MRFTLLLSSACFVFAPMASAQDFGLTGPAQIETQELGQAKDFDPGVLQEGALDTALWQGTSAARAARLLSDAPYSSDDPLVQLMLRTVVLSGGVPPVAGSQEAERAYETARLQAVLALESGTDGALDTFLTRNPALARAPLAQVDLALVKGDWQRACEISDTITTDRAQPQWARLRAACHGLRGEMSAADVTRDLLRSSGYNDPAYHAQMDALLTGRRAPTTEASSDALVAFLARYQAQQSGAPVDDNAPVAGRDADLAALFKSFDTVALSRLSSTLGNISFDIAGPDLDLETAMANPGARATARLFILGQSGDAAALDAFISRAVRAGVDEDVVLNKLSPMIQTLPARARVETNLKRYTRAAVLARDIGGLQQIYAALPESPMQARVALVTDALGGGFAAQGLGRDIEGRLENPATRAQAVTDAQMALALGATVSDRAAVPLSKAVLPRATLPEAEYMLLDAAVRANSRAETSLQAAAMLSRAGLNATDHARIVSALTRAGLQQFAGPIAAENFMAGL